MSGCAGLFLTTLGTLLHLDVLKLPPVLKRAPKMCSKAAPSKSSTIKNKFPNHVARMCFQVLFNGVQNPPKDLPNLNNGPLNVNSTACPWCSPTIPTSPQHLCDAPWQKESLVALSEYFSIRTPFCQLPSNLCYNLSTTFSVCPRNYKRASRLCHHGLQSFSKTTSNAAALVLTCSSLPTA